MTVGRPVGRSGPDRGITWDEATESLAAAEAAEAPDGRDD